MATKSFKNDINPAFSFISTETEQSTQMKHGKPPKGFKVNPLYIETKCRRLQLLLQPSLYERVKAKADANKTSVNEFIHSVLEEAVKM